MVTPPIPPAEDANNALNPDSLKGVPITAFPKWVKCPACDLIAPLDIGVFALKEDPYHPDKTRFVHSNCDKVTGGPPPVLPVRFVRSCNNGHLDDFPWRDFVCGRNSGCNGALRLYEFGVSAQADDIVVKCGTCQKSSPMTVAFSEAGKALIGKCRGKHPHLGIQEKCDEESKSMLAGASVAARHCAFGPGARWQLSLPVDHVGGLSLIFRALAGGGALLAGGTTTGETHRSLVATQLRRLLDGDETPDLQCLLLGGGPIVAPLRQAALEAGLPLVVSYGLTETGAMVTASAPDDPPELLTHPHYAGRLLVPGTVAVSDDGIVQIKGPMLCQAMADDDGVPRSPTLTDGWLSTGDLGRLEGDRLFVTGRRDNVMISGGEKLAAEELEAALLALDGVLEAVVVPVDDVEFGQRPGAFLRWAAGQERSLEEIRRELEDRLASWKMPMALWPLPDHVGFKPDRAALTRLANPR